MTYLQKPNMFIIFAAALRQTTIFECMKTAVDGTGWSFQNLYCRTDQSLYLVICCKTSIFNPSNPTFLFLRGHVVRVWCHIYISHQLFLRISWTIHTQFQSSCPDTLLLHQCFLSTTNYLPTNTLTHVQCINGSKAVKNNEIKSFYLYFWQTLFLTL